MEKLAWWHDAVRKKDKWRTKVWFKSYKDTHMQSLWTIAFFTWFCFSNRETESNISLTSRTIPENLTCEQKAESSQKSMMFMGYNHDSSKEFSKRKLDMDQSDKKNSPMDDYRNILSVKKRLTRCWWMLKQNQKMYRHKSLKHAVQTNCFVTA